MRKVGDKAVPQYLVMLGGGVDSGHASFGRIAAKVPARRIPEAVERLVALYTAEGKPGEDARSFLRRLEVPRVTALLADLEALSPETATSPPTSSTSAKRRSSGSRRRKGSASPRSLSEVSPRACDPTDSARPRPG